MDVFLDRSRSMPNVRRMTTVLSDNVHEAVSSVALTARHAGHETHRGCLEFIPIIREAASSGIEAVQSFASTVYERGRNMDIKETLATVQQLVLTALFVISEHIRSLLPGHSDQSSSSS